MYLARCNADSGNRRVAIFTILSVSIRSLRYLISTEKCQKPLATTKARVQTHGHGQKVSNTLKRKIMSFGQKYSQAQPSALLLASQTLSSLQPLLGT